MCLTGYDKHGHIIMCERLCDIKAAELASTFPEDQLMVLISQRQDAIQYMQNRESLKHQAEGGDRTYKHVHFIDVSGLSMWGFMSSKTTLTLNAVCLP